MSLQAFLSFAALSGLAHFVVGQDVGGCREGTCTDCLGTVFWLGNGYPECRVHSNEPFREAGFPAAENGGVDVFFDIPEPGPTCAYIIRTPAYTDDFGCGINVLSARNGQCTRLTLQETWAAQFCCGTGHCEEAGAGTGIMSAGGGSTQGMAFIMNGTEIPEIKHYPKPVEAKLIKKEADADPNPSKSARLSKRDCVFTPNGDPYTSPGLTQVVDPQIQNGPASVEISYEVSVGYTTTISAGLSFEVFSAGFEFSIEESVTEGLSYTYQIPDGQNGVITWTAIMTCYSGATDGCAPEDNQEGDFCFATRDGNGQPVGQYALQIRN